jgi:hypothetical protein
MYLFELDLRSTVRFTRADKSKHSSPDSDYFQRML